MAPKKRRSSTDTGKKKRKAKAKQDTAAASDDNASDAQSDSGADSVREARYINLPSSFTSPENFALQCMCEFNGISEREFLEHAHLTTKLECFQIGRCDLAANLQYFTGLTELIVNNQPEVCSLEGVARHDSAEDFLD